MSSRQRYLPWFREPRTLETVFKEEHKREGWVVLPSGWHYLEKNPSIGFMSHVFVHPDLGYTPRG